MSEIDDAYEVMKDAYNRFKYENWRYFDPYPKQRLFMELGGTFKERLLMAGNQVGKSDTGGYESSRHLTGIYPDWWKGLRFDQNTGPCDMWVGGTSGESLRDAAQTKLFGLPGVEEAFGTGLIPKDAIIGRPSASRGATNGIDTAHIRHVSGGVSILGFKTYKQDRTDWQGPPKKFLWFDEEPPMTIFSEGVARLGATRGSFIMTFTPLFGFSEPVKRFLEPEPEFMGMRRCVQMACADAMHMTPEAIAELKSRYPKHEWPARIDGNPHMSGGRVFDTPEEMLMEDFVLPETLGRYAPIRADTEWEYIWGIDFWIDHPFAAVLLAYDRARDAGHVIACMKMSDQLVLQHADAMKKIGEQVPVAWPHDGHVRDRQSGEQMAEIYRRHRLHMLPEHAQYPNGSYSTEAGIMDLDTAMHANRFRVARHLSDWFAEYRLYHREKKDTGLVELVKKNDDLMSATRQAWMQRRSAKKVPLGELLAANRPRREFVGAIIDPHSGRPVY